MSGRCCVVAVALVASGALAEQPPPSAASAPPKDVALVVGIEKYVFVSKVPGARQNALDWRDFLRSRGATTFELLDNEATSEGILAAAEKVAAEAKPGGRVWFVYIGHGAPLPRTGADGKLDEPEAGLVTVDAQQNARSLTKRSIPLPQVLAALNKGAQRETVAIVDACFSGNTPSGAIVPDLQPLLAMRSKPEARVVQLSAGRSNEFAGPLPGYGRPAFSYLTLGAMKGWADSNGDGVVTSGEAIEYSQRVLSRVLTDRSQNPELVGDDVQLGPSQGDQGPSLEEFQNRAREAASLVVNADGKVVNTGRRTAGWVLVGTGGALAVGAIILGQVAAGTARSANKEASVGAANSRFDEAKSLALVTDIGLGVAVAAAATGVILIATSTTDAVTVAPWLSPTGGGALVSTQF